jgi:hypothetical protein
VCQTRPLAEIDFTVDLWLRVIEGDRVLRRALGEGEEASYGTLAPILGRADALGTSSRYVNAGMGITYGAASGMVAPLAVPTAAAKVTWESYTGRERGGVPIAIFFHPGLAACTRSRGLSASALDEEGVDVRVSHAHDLLRLYAASDEVHGNAGKLEYTLLEGILDVRAQLLIGHVEFEEARVAGRRAPYETGRRWRLQMRG